MIAIESNVGQIGVRFLRGSKSIERAIVQRLRKIGAALQLAIAKEKLSGQSLVRRTGNLTRALFYKVSLEGTDAVLQVGADGKKAKCAAIQEEGGTIRPVNSANLAIPLDAARTAKGVARMSAREFFANPSALGFDARSSTR